MLSFIPHEILLEVESRTNSKVKSFSQASGGCINEGGKITTTSGIYFLKWNYEAIYPGMFSAEAKGLSLLSQSKSLTIPKVVLTGITANRQFLMLEYIDAGKRKPTYWSEFGVQLAKLHRNSMGMFGLDHDNYIGSLHQFNQQSSSWVNFFIDQRLRIQLRLATDAGKLHLPALKKFESLFEKLRDLLPEEPPSLLHGDLWGGNIMTASTGEPCLIDPAVYFGHREVDVAMTRLFGGFDDSYLEAYNEAYPLQPGYEERIDIYNLYPLLVHVNLFGGGYANQVRSILNRFV